MVNGLLWHCSSQLVLCAFTSSLVNVCRRHVARCRTGSRGVLGMPLLPVVLQICSVTCEDLEGGAILGNRKNREALSSEHCNT